MRFKRWGSFAAVALAAAVLATGCGLIRLPFAGPPADGGLQQLTYTEIAVMGGSSSGEVYLTATIDARTGTLTVERRHADSYERAMTPQEIGALERLLDEVGFFDLRPDYVPAGGCCGITIFEVTVERGQEVFKVRASEETRPDALYQVLAHVRSLLSE